MLPRKYVCGGCGGPRERCREVSPGEWKYDRCEFCKAMGIVRVEDHVHVPAGQKRSK